MSKDIVGIALAAGMGTRLRPITGNIPKPLAPFFGTPLLEFIISKLERAQVKELGLNTHYLSEKIDAYLEQYGHSGVFVSKEWPEILGTAGAYHGFRSWLGSRTALSHNGDVLSSTDLETLKKIHFETEATATLAVLSRPHSSGSHVWVKGNQVMHIGPDHDGHHEATPHGFACIQMLSHTFFSSLGEVGYSELVPLLNRLIKEGKRVSAYIDQPAWFDLGNAKDYFDCHMYVLDELSQGRDPFCLFNTLDRLMTKYSFIPQGQELSFGTSHFIGPCFLEGELSRFRACTIGPHTIVSKNAVISDGCKIENSILNPGSIVEKKISRAILGADYRIDLG